MVGRGIPFYEGCVPVKFEKAEDGILVTYKDYEGKETVEKYKTVLLAIGRYADTKLLNLENIGV